MWPPTLAFARGTWWSLRPDTGGHYALWSGKTRRRRTRRPRRKGPPRTGRSRRSGGPGKNGNGPCGRAWELRLPPLRQRRAPPPGSPLLQDRLPPLRFPDDQAIQCSRRRKNKRTGGRPFSKTRRRPRCLHRLPGVCRRLPRSGHRDAGRQGFCTVRPMHQLPGLYPGLSGKCHKVGTTRARWPSGRTS
jgi:hypothetical protein